MRAFHKKGKSGVTLLELLVALSIGGLAIVGAMRLLDQLGDAGDRIAIAALTDARASNGDRLLRKLVADVRTTTDSTRRFRGDARNAIFYSLCDTPSGWRESCRASLMIDSLGDSSAVLAQLDGDGPLELRRLPGAARFIYFDAAARDSAWSSAWDAGITLPAAIGLVTARDTLVLPLGARP